MSCKVGSILQVDVAGAIRAAKRNGVGAAQVAPDVQGEIETSLMTARKVRNLIRGDQTRIGIEEGRITRPQRFFAAGDAEAAT